MWTSSKACSAYALTILVAAGNALAGPTVTLRGTSLNVGDVPAVGACLADVGSYKTTCTDLGDDAPNYSAAVVAVGGIVRVRHMECVLAGLGYLEIGDSVTHCVAWMTDADQTPECIPGASVAVAGDMDTLISPMEGISVPSSSVNLSSGGALAIMVSATTDGGVADDSIVAANCRADIEVMP